MNRIDRMFSQLKKRKEAALIPFITTGDPDIATTSGSGLRDFQTCPGIHALHCNRRDYCWKRHYKTD